MSTLDDRVTSLLAKPSLEGLAYALRHPQVWPEGFKWSYAHCETCAMGMAVELWSLRVKEEGNATYRNAICNAIEIERTVATKIFCELGPALGASMWDVTPEHVADAIDAYLAQRG